MKPLWTSDAIAKAVGGRASQPFDVNGVAFDSREVGPGDLFIAMKGETSDGHLFLDKAFANGAAGAICEQDIAEPHVRVEDSAVALNQLGRAARARTEAKIIGVTGSAGKTGTKEALFRCLDRIEPGAAHRSVKSYNNHVGVPLSFARMPQECRFGIFEMGMNHAGELAELTQLVRPHVAMVTTIAPAHLGYFSSIEAIADAKGEIFAGLEPGGTAIIPFDSPYRDRLIAAAKPYAETIITFGLGEGADARALDWVPTADGGTLITASLPNKTSLCFTLAAPGEHWVANAMAVLAAVQAVGGDLAAAGLALAELPGLAGRGARHQLTVGEGSALLIDESYNANPASMAATIGQLGREPATRRIAVLGAMRELGDDADHYHAALAAHLEDAGIDWAILVGDEMKILATALEGKREFAHGPDAAWALALLKERMQPGDAILIKGSNAVGLGKIISALTGGET